MRALKLFCCLTVAIIFLTGCSKEETLTCSNSEESSGVSMEQIVKMTFKDDKINKVKMTINSKATSSLIQDNWDMFASTMDSQFTEKDSDGITISTNNDKEKYIYKVELTVDLDKATKESLEEYGLDDITDDNSTLEETKKSAEEDGFTCK